MDIDERPPNMQILEMNRLTQDIYVVQPRLRRTAARRRLVRNAEYAGFIYRENDTEEILSQIVIAPVASSDLENAVMLTSKHKSAIEFSITGPEHLQFSVSDGSRNYDDFSLVKRGEFFEGTCNFGKHYVRLWPVLKKERPVHKILDLMK